jgi:hypothetical protein
MFTVVRTSNLTLLGDVTAKMTPYPIEGFYYMYSYILELTPLSLKVNFKRFQSTFQIPFYPQHLMSYSNLYGVQH